MRDANFYCDRGDCKKRFGFRLDLERHLRLHDNTLLQCFFCPWTGVKNNHIEQHMNHHFKFRPVKCSFCDEKFYSSNHRRSHEERYHEKISDRYKCNICDFKHHSRDGIYRHNLKSHKN